MSPLNRTKLLVSLPLLLFAGLTCDGQDFHHWTFEGGAGLTVPSGSAQNQWNLGWNLKAGGGYNLNSHISGLVEFDYAPFSLSNAALQSYGQLGGYNNFWSLSLNPRYDFNLKGRTGMYVTGGYGLYTRTLAFTDPTQIQQYCDPYSGFCSTSGAPVIASFTNHKEG